MDDATLTSVLNDITAAVGILGSLTPSGAPEVMRLLNQAKTLYTPTLEPVVPPEEVPPPSTAGDPVASATPSSSRSRTSG